MSKKQDVEKLDRKTYDDDSASLKDRKFVEQKH